MKKIPIYVMGPAAKPVLLNGGKHVVAIRPAGKGEDGSYVLLNDGACNTLKGARILGVGIKRYITEAGYIEATDDNKDATSLADYINCQEGLKYVEKTAANEAVRIQLANDGKEMLYVPFDPNQAVKPIKVADNGTRSTVLAFGSGYVAPCVRGDYIAGYILDANLGTGWLIPKDADPATMPRSTDYGGLVEEAIFVLANSGLVESFDPPALKPSGEDAPADAPFLKGKVSLQLAGTTDKLIVGIDALDELVVQYVRDGSVLYQRKGLGHKSTNRLHVGVAIGAIAAVLVRVADMDDQGAKQKKAA